MILIVIMLWCLIHPNVSIIMLRQHYINTKLTLFFLSHTNVSTSVCIMLLEAGIWIQLFFFCEQYTQFKEVWCRVHQSAET